MTSIAPSPASTRCAPGSASLTVNLVARESTVTSAFATSPLKLLTPRSRGRTAWACLSNLGGGLVAGDETRLELQVGPGASCFLTSQASTKIYRNPFHLPCGHTTRAEVADGATLVFAPDVVQAFADSSYVQRQEFHLASTAGLVLLDWLASGRTERGERWLFRRYQSRNDVFVAGERRVIDALLLEPAQASLGPGSRMGHYHCLAMLLLIGSPLAKAAETLLADISAREISRRAPLLASVSPIAGGALLRVAGESVEAVHRELQRHLRGFMIYDL